VAALAVALALALVPAGPRAAYVHRGSLVVVDLATGRRRVVLRHAGFGPVRWSGDGRLVSSGGRIAGGPHRSTLLDTGAIAWAPSGERAAYVTRRGGVEVWSPTGGRRRVVADGWGAQSVAWSANGRLAVGRAVCHVPCGLPTRVGVWVWTGRRLRGVVALPPRAQVTPMPFGWARGRVLWWAWPDSGSIAADGVALYANGRRLGVGLMYPDYVAVCGGRVAFTHGHDRYAVHGKSIVLDGHDVSHDETRSWVSPACSTDGTTLVASASRSRRDELMGHEHRSIWRLLPTRRRLTRPPAGWTDESPRILRDGSILFVRTRQVPRRRTSVTERGTLELLRRGRLTAVADVGFTTSTVGEGLYTSNYYGHYGWPSLVAVAP
jgi:hypothetical protein